MNIFKIACVASLFSACISAAALYAKPEPAVYVPQKLARNHDTTYSDGVRHAAQLCQARVLEIMKAQRTTDAGYAKYLMDACVTINGATI